MATVTPVKIKAHLGKVKEEILNDSLQDVNEVLKALVLMELVQRGVIPGASHTDDVSKIVVAVQTTAGKALVVEGLPKPLLAGMSAMAGMVAEKCANLLQHSEASLGDLKEAEARCKVVTDDRLLTLLQAINLEDAKDRQSRILILAQGYFLRAASFQPDQPQMWKRALDNTMSLSTLQRGEEEQCLESSFPLQNMIRVAKTKGNQKRVSELSLKLAESLLSPRAETTSHVDSVVKLFVAPYRSKLESSTKKSQQTLEDCSASLLDQDGTLRYHWLVLRVEMEGESAATETLAAEKLTAAKNRGASNETLKSCQSLARKEILLQSLEGKSIENRAEGLCQVVLDCLGEMPKTTKPLRDSVELLAQFICRIQERGQVVGLASIKGKPAGLSNKVTECYGQTIDFCKSILLRVAEVSAWQAVEVDEQAGALKHFLVQQRGSLLPLLECCTLATIRALWMSFGRLQEPKLPLPMLRFLRDLLVCLIDDMDEREAINQEKSTAKGSVVAATISPTEQTRTKFELSLATANALVCIYSSEAPTQEFVDRAMKLSTDKTSSNASTTQFGSQYLHFLLSWYGFCRSPWSFSNVTQARAIVKNAKQCVEKSMSEYGRAITELEISMLDVALADAEGGYLAGGLGKVATKLYERSLESTGNMQLSYQATLTRSHCFGGLSRLALAGFALDDSVEKSAMELSEEFARSCLDEAGCIDDDATLAGLPSLCDASSSPKSYHSSLARQLVANALVRDGRIGDAESFLVEAVADAPGDFDASFALGAFKLRLVFFPVKGREAINDKEAQVQLLKAAKLASGKAGPFALLGFWYEKKDDTKRAVGCYSKALSIEPAHPVAGRGLLRLKSFNDSQAMCRAASESNSSLNGWAWRAIGQNKAMSDAADEMAIICFQEALRKADVSNPESEALSTFFDSSDSLLIPELSRVWSELAGCYRRLGRYTASIRAFDSAWSSSSEGLDAAFLVSWAEVELELGLVDEAAEKFERARDLGDDYMNEVASYGLGSALLCVAKRDAADGKAGAAYSTLKRALSIMDEVNSSLTSSSFRCSMKLLGDIYSMGALLPADVFDDENSAPDTTTSNLFENGLKNLEKQLAFLENGEKYYEKAYEACGGEEIEEESLHKAVLACDIGTNVLLQAQLQCIVHGEGQPIEEAKSNSELPPLVKKTVHRSSESFIKSIKHNPIFAPAWCGYGCAVMHSDPMLAQHAFSRALEIDKSLPDSWANLGFLYASRQSPESASRVLSELTQVADTPMMWICRAAMLERDATEDCLAQERRQYLLQAHDAYKAALQVTKDPIALLGCAMTSGISTGSVSSAYFAEYTSLSPFDFGATVLHQAMEVQDNLLRERNESSKDINTSLSIIDDAAAFGKPQDGIDVDIFKGLKSAIKQPVLSTDAVESMKANFQREIILDPINGQLRLQFAECLAKELLSVKESSKRRHVLQKLESATFAARKAVSVLSGQMVKPVACNRVAAGDVAQAFALTFWLSQIETELYENIRDPPSRSPNKGVALQRALMLDPTNRLARDSFRHEQDP